MDRAATLAPFWHCAACGTPNPSASYLTRCVGCGADRAAVARAGAPRRGRGGGWGRAVVGAGWVYAAALAAVIVAVRLTGDRWWATTFLLFGPRWVALIMPAALAIAAGLVRRRSAIWPIGLASALAVGPGMGFCLPWGALVGSGGSPTLRLRVLTCNVEGGRAEGLAAVIDAERPDVVVLQECPAEGAWRASLFEGRGWQIRSEGGGVALASRFPIRSTAIGALARPAWAGGMIVRHAIETPNGPVDVYGVHLETPRPGFEAVIRGRWAGLPELRAVIEQRLRESEAAARWVAESSSPAIVAGDFNMPADGTIYRACWSGFTNAFSAAGLGLGHSKFTRFFGIRIDHILGDSGWRARRCVVGPYVGSDHRPVIADLEWTAPGG